MGQGELRQCRSGRADLSCLVWWAASRPASETDQGPPRLAAATYELTWRTWPTSPTPTTISYATGCRSTTTSNPPDLVGEALHRLGDLTAKVVADIGCGNGTYLRALSEAGAVALGLDLSAGMLRAVPDGHGDLALADAQSLPLRTGCVDAAIAMHMLYHVPDPALAVREVRRVLRPGGRFIAAIGGPAHLAEARQSWSSLLRNAGLGPELQDLGLTNTRLSVPRLEELLRENFPEVRLSMLTSHVVLTSAAPLAKFAASTTVAKLAAAQGADMSKSFVGP